MPDNRDEERAQDDIVDIALTPQLNLAPRVTGIDERTKAYLATLPSFPVTLTGYFPCDRCGKGHAESEPCPTPCGSVPCLMCGACSECQDFHFYGGGCTEDRCPLSKEATPSSSR